MILSPSEYSLSSLPVSYRFAAIFFALGIIPNPVDIRFQKISGLSVEVDTHIVKEGGENIFPTHLPDGIKSNNLVLERGMVVGSWLNLEFNSTMSFFKFNPCNVMVALLNEKYLPIASWLFLKAFPVKWKVSDLDGSANSIVIDTFELAYQRVQIIRV